MPTRSPAARSKPNTDTVTAAGAVYVYQRGDQGWTPVAYLKALEPSADSLFGISVAAHSGRSSSARRGSRLRMPQAERLRQAPARPISTSATAAASRRSRPFTPPALARSEFRLLGCAQRPLCGGRCGRGWRRPGQRERLRSRTVDACREPRFEGDAAGAIPDRTAVAGLGCVQLADRRSVRDYATSDTSVPGFWNAGSGSGSSPARSGSTHPPTNPSTTSALRCRCRTMSCSWSPRQRNSPTCPPRRQRTATRSSTPSALAAPMRSTAEEVPGSKPTSCGVNMHKRVKGRSRSRP